LAAAQGHPFQRFQMVEELRESLQGISDRSEISGVSASLTEPAQGAFNITDSLHRPATGIQQKRLIDQFLDQRLPASDPGQVSQRFQDPLAEHAPAHWRNGPIYRR